MRKKKRCRECGKHAIEVKDSYPVKTGLYKKSVVAHRVRRCRCGACGHATTYYDVPKDEMDRLVLERARLQELTTLIGQVVELAKAVSPTPPLIQGDCNEKNE